MAASCPIPTTVASVTSSCRSVVRAQCGTRADSSLAVVRVIPGFRLRSSFKPANSRTIPTSAAGSGQGRKRSPSSTLSVRCKLADVAESEFEAAVLQSELPVLVDFCASWCGPCRLVVPILDWAAKEYEGQLKVVKMDVDASPKVVEQYKVYGLPSLVLFKDGQEVSHIEGAVTKQKLQILLTQTLPTLSASS
eukprot:TRINITY_DN545_c0_g1_i1.p1 TRINITY_DN545_c0_g1~~TRINITY_DN545_c0_g1_i1.p1  ORF type:complete len:193 (-),score=32.37 TRINITY_DN545_c0_g1_i1:161-739(-)